METPDEFFEKEIDSLKAIIKDNMSQLGRAISRGDFLTARRSLGSAFQAEKQLVSLNIEEAAHAILHNEIQESVAMLERASSAGSIKTSPSVNVEDLSGREKVD
jgi:hypothetical protein